MKTNHDQIMKALAGLIPEDAQEKVSAAISTFLENAVAELEEEYNKQLENAYKDVHEERHKDQATAEEGYNQAWEIICDLRDRLEVQKEEFDKALEEGYEEAYEMLQEERAKNDSLEVDLYEEYDRRLADIKEFMIDKIDRFLQLQGEKYYEMAKRDVMNDPALAEHKVAFEKILEVAASYLSDEDYAFATSSRVDSLQKSLDDTKAQMKILEAKNMRLGTENNKLNEAVRQSQELLHEHVGRNEKKARAEKARRAEGRGQILSEDRQVVIGETKESGEPVQRRNQSSDEPLVESIGEEVFQDWKHLSGLTKEEEAAE